MKIKGLLLIFLTIIISIGTIGCNNKSTDKTVKDETVNKEVTKEQNNNNTNTLDNNDYKDILIKNYEKYIQPLDMSEYDDLDKLLLNNSNIDNQKFIEDFKGVLKESKTNISSFEKSITGLILRDNKLQILNDKLVKEVQVLLEDIKAKEIELDKIDSSIISKPSKEFLHYIEEKLDKDNLEKNRFEDTLEEIESLLGIDLDK